MNLNEMNLSPEELATAKRNAEQLEEHFQEAKLLMSKKQVAEANLILTGLLHKLRSLDNTNLNKSEIIGCYGETLLSMDKVKEGKHIIRCCMIVWEQNGSERAINLLEKYSTLWRMDNLIPEIIPFKPKLSFFDKVKIAISKPLQSTLRINFPDNVEKLAQSKYPM